MLKTDVTDGFVSDIKATDVGCYVREGQRNTYHNAKTSLICTLQ
ncbi:hypothetical protein [Lysinibacillus sp. FSL K6-3209]